MAANSSILNDLFIALSFDYEFHVSSLLKRFPSPALPLSTFYLHSANPTPSRDPSQRPLSAFLSNQYSEFDTQNKRFQARIYVGGRKSSICYSVPVLPHTSQFFFSFLHLPANLMFLHSRFKKKSIVWINCLLSFYEPGRVYENMYFLAVIQLRKKN